MRSHGMETLSGDKYHGRISSYDIERLGYNCRVTEIQSALGLVQLKKLDRNNRKRRGLVEIYRSELQGMKGISIPFLQSEGYPSYHLSPILVHAGPDLSPCILTDGLMEGLRNFRIQTSVHYPPIHLFFLYRRKFGFTERMLPKTEEVSRREITLPLHPRMDAGDVKWIAKKVKEVVEQSGRDGR